jgi:two-component system OmpR family response regulator
LAICGYDIGVDLDAFAGQAGSEFVEEHRLRLESVQVSDRNWVHTGVMRILVVEDEEGIATALQRGLTADGFAVDVADNGIDGLWMAQNNPYACIVLDLMLPGLNGFLVCKQLREDENWTPILMLTAKDGDLDEAEGLETGADDYMTKPFSYVVLLARIRNLLRRSGPPQSGDELVVGDLRLDCARHAAWRGDKELALSPRAMAVFEFLMRNAGRVTSKDEILRNVWDDAFEGDPNIVEVYVSRIRQAIDTSFDRSALQTVRGVGYRLAEDGG